MTRFVYLVRHGEAPPHNGPLSQTGREQARLTGERLREVPLDAIVHGPLPRAAQTAAIIAAGFPGVPVTASDLAGDYIPSDPDPADLPPAYARFVSGYTAAERAHGARLAGAAAGGRPVGQAAIGLTRPGGSPAGSGGGQWWVTEW